MSAVDFVEYSGRCPSCGVMLTKWQTYDGLPFGKTVKPEDVNDFSGICPSCNKIINAHVIKRFVDVELTAVDNLVVD